MEGSPRPRVYIQIGTNNGNDLFRNKVREDRPDTIILVEPNPALTEEIAKNYDGIPNVHIVTAAVYYRDDETVSLYIPAMGGQYGTPGENRYTYGDAHFSLLPMNDWGRKENMVELRAPTITVSSLCARFGITTVDYLQMDTEGFDSEIIQMLPLDTVRILSIRFETWGFSPTEFVRYHAPIAHRLGAVGMQAAISRLTEHGYMLSPISDEDGNDILAVLPDP